MQTDSHITLHTEATRSFVGVLRIAWACVAVVLASRLAGAGLNPIREFYDAIPGHPLVLAVRPDAGTTPPARVTLRFPDGQEIAGDVAAIGLGPPPAGPNAWLAPGPTWRVFTPAEAARRGDASLTWFVLAEAPRGVIGQEVWLDGVPIRLRWLSRDRLLAARLGFSDADTGEGPLRNPWTSPLPEAWRERDDLLARLQIAAADPTRAWRVDLATTGLFPAAERGVGPVTPEMLGSGIVEASRSVRPVASRLLEAVSEQNAARWRIALARLWAADPAVSLRVRHALAGAAAFDDGEGGRAVAPVWPAGDAVAARLLETLLDPETPVVGRRDAAEAWLAALPDARLWTIDDGGPGAGATIGALLLRAGEAALVPAPDASGAGVPARPVVLGSREMSALRTLPRESPATGGRDASADRADRAVYRLLGETRSVGLLPSSVAAVPPGVPIAGLRPAFDHAGWLADGAPAADEGLGSGRITIEPGRDGPSVRVLLRLDGVDEPRAERVRLWLGPFGLPSAVLTLGLDGSLDIAQAAGGVFDDPPRPIITLDGRTARVSVALPPRCVGDDGIVRVAVERLGAAGERASWPRAVLPWQGEPGRVAIDTTRWLGDLGP